MRLNISFYISLNVIEQTVNMPVIWESKMLMWRHRIACRTGPMQGQIQTNARWTGLIQIQLQGWF